VGLSTVDGPHTERKEGNMINRASERINRFRKLSDVVIITEAS
jgi:hypothetical protein